MTVGFMVWHSSYGEEVGVQEARKGVECGLGLSRGSYPTPFLGRLLCKITDPNHKTRTLKTG